MTVNEEVDLLRAACCIAGLDGDIQPAEMQLLEKLCTDAGVGEASFQAMLDLAKSDNNFYMKQLGWTRTDPQRTIKVLIKVAKASGDVTQIERIILGHFAEKIGLDREKVQAVLQE
ncbi:MAG: hypothetical protein AAGI17_09540 [Planctomycetota bacterium]